MDREITRVIAGAVQRLRTALGMPRGYDKDVREACLLSGGSVTPDTLEQRLLVKALTGAGRLPVDALVGLVATELYRKEIRSGTSADVGLFGSHLFVPDVLSALEAGKGRLWTISAGAPSAS